MEGGNFERDVKWIVPRLGQDREAFPMEYPGGPCPEAVLRWASMRRRLLSLLKSRQRWLLLGLVVVLWYALAYPRGMVMAYIDHWRGAYKVQTMTYPDKPEWHCYIHLMRFDYGVTVEPTRGWAANSDEWYADGYNSVSRRLLIRKHGRDIFRESEEGAVEWCRRTEERLRREREEADPGGHRP